MAHILVYLQRTPGGLHPASSVALCRARDIASERGATITAICRGDAGPLDKGVAAAASRFGADVLVWGAVAESSGLVGAVLVAVAGALLVRGHRTDGPAPSPTFQGARYVRRHA